MIRCLGLGVLLLACATTAKASERYVEVWNPPEARACAPHKVNAGHRLAGRGRDGTHALKVKAHRTRASSALKLAARSTAQTGAQAATQTSMQTSAQTSSQTGVQSSAQAATQAATQLSTQPSAQPSAQSASQPAASLAAKPGRQEHGTAPEPSREPDFLRIPRQITPEGNVLRVDSRNVRAEVVR